MPITIFTGWRMPRKVEEDPYAVSYERLEQLANEEMQQRREGTRVPDDPLEPTTYYRRHKGGF